MEGEGVRDPIRKAVFQILKDPHVLHADSLLLQFRATLIAGLENAGTYHLLWACGSKPDVQLQSYRVYKEAIVA